jgi:hypothetical protein
MTKKIWLLFVLVVGVGTAVGLAAANAFVPTVADVKDPLGRPSSLSLEVIHSASEFDRLTFILVPKHRDLSGRIQTLTAVAADLDTLVGEAGGLSGKAISVNAFTTSVNSTAGPLPGLIAGVAARAHQAAPVVGNLGTAVSSVAGQLQAINGGLADIYGDLAALGPRATTINNLLAQIQEESQRIRSLGPVLSSLSGLLDPVINGATGGLLSGLLDRNVHPAAN